MQKYNVYFYIYRGALWFYTKFLVIFLNYLYVGWISPFLALFILPIRFLKRLLKDKDDDDKNKKNVDDKSQNQDQDINIVDKKENVK